MSKEKLPVWKNDSEESLSLRLMHMFNWFSYYKSTDDAEKYFNQYCSNKFGRAPSPNYKLPMPGYGWLAKILDSNPEAHLGDYQERLDLEANRACTVVKIPRKAPSVPQNPAHNVQKSIDARCRELYAELEFQFDKFVENKFSNDFDVAAWLNDSSAKDSHCKKLAEYIKKQIAEYKNYISDPELFEGAGFSKSQLKKIIKHFEINLAEVESYFSSIQKIKNINKLPRKKKPRPPALQVAKMVYQLEHDGHKGLRPQHMIGAQEIWLYNTKRQRLGIYHAQSRDGIQAKGKSLFNFDVDKSVWKRVPSKNFKTILENISTESGKVKRRKYFEGIKTAKEGMKGRIDEHTLILLVD